MFQRIVYEDWHLVFPVVAFASAAAVFAAMCWRALRMKPERAERLARMPLDDSPTSSDLHE